MATKDWQIPVMFTIYLLLQLVVLFITMLGLHACPMLLAGRGEKLCNFHYREMTEKRSKIGKKLS